MIQIATDPSQSARLIACGLDPKSADFIWQEPITTSQKRTGGKILVFRNPNHQTYVGDVPAWSLSRLLSLLPNRILVDDAWHECQICICPFGYEVRYHSEVFKDPFGCLCRNPIEGCVEAIEWLNKYGYKLNTT